jgi:hypothetical protein
MTASKDSPLALGPEELLNLIGSAQAPFIFADGVTAAGIWDGVLALTLTAQRVTRLPSGQNHSDLVPVAHLRLSQTATKLLASLLGQTQFNAFADGVEIEAPTSREPH